MFLKDYDNLSDGEIYLKILSKNNGDIEKERCPEYKFQIFLHKSQVAIGHINLRFGEDEKLLKYLGHIGYGINEEFRGNKYSQKACKLITQVLNDHHVNRIIVTCNPDNFPSRKICENLELNLLEIADTRVYSENEPKKCIYEWIL